MNDYFEDIYFLHNNKGKVVQVNAWKKRYQFCLLLMKKKNKHFILSARIVLIQDQNQEKGQNVTDNCSEPNFFWLIDFRKEILSIIMIYESVEKD